jgi:hypothetical protein
MKIKDLTKGKYKYDLDKWGKKAPEGAIMVFYTNVFEDVYSYYHFEFKDKKCGEERGYYPNGSLLFVRYYREPGIMDYDIRFDKNGNIDLIQEEIHDPKTESYQANEIEDSFEIKKFIAKRRLELLYR